MELLGDDILLPDIPISYETETDSNGTLSDEIHLLNFLLFVVDDLVFLMHTFELPWHEAESVVVEKLGFIFQINFEKSFELDEHIRK